MQTVVVVAGPWGEERQETTTAPLPALAVSTRWPTPRKTAKIGGYSIDTLVRLSVDHGPTWFDGDTVGNPHVGDPSVVEFELHDVSSLRDIPAGRGHLQRAINNSYQLIAENSHCVLVTPHQKN